uniref:SERPIN domain-containing protein n=1 Tax=Globodera pallida TaxID=36090 RepID=A0A183C2P7_GLOPA
MKSSLWSIFITVFLLSVVAEFASSAKISPFSGGQLANEVARAFLNSVNTWNSTIFGVGKKDGEDRYKINLDSLDRLKNSFRVPMPAGQGLEKLLRSQRVDPVKENIGTKGNERVLAPYKLMELMEKLGNVSVTDKKLREKIDKYEKKKADEAAKRAAAMPKKEDPQATAKRRTWVAKNDGSDSDKGSDKGKDSSPTRHIRVTTTKQRVWMETDADADTPRWRSRLTFSRKNDRQKSWLESDSEDESPTEMRSRRRSRVQILDENSDEPGWRRSPTPFRRSASPNVRWTSRTTTTTSWVDEENGERRRKVKFGEVSVVSSPEEGGGGRRTETRQQRVTEVERRAENVLILKLDFMDASEFLDKASNYFASLNAARRGEGGVQRMCFALKNLDPKHDKLNAVLGTPSVANFFGEFKKALNDVGLTNQAELRLVQKSNSCAFDLALIFALAQVTKDLLSKLKAERMVPTEELDDSKTELVNRLVKLFDKFLDGLKVKGAERSTEVDRRVEAAKEIEDQLNTLEKVRLTDATVTDAMGKVMAQLRRVARDSQTAEQRSLKTLQIYWDALMKKDTHWQIRKAMSSLEKCQADTEGNTNGLKTCMETVMGGIGKYIDDVDEWFKAHRPIDMEDWNWLVDIQFLIRWKSI